MARSRLVHAADWFVALYRVTATGKTSASRRPALPTLGRHDCNARRWVSRHRESQRHDRRPGDRHDGRLRRQRTVALDVMADRDDRSRHGERGTCVDHADHDGAAGVRRELQHRRARNRRHLQRILQGTRGRHVRRCGRRRKRALQDDERGHRGRRQHCARRPVSINSGAAATNSTSVTLNLDATDATGVTAYRIANGAAAPPPRMSRHLNYSVLGQPRTHAPLRRRLEDRVRAVQGLRGERVGNVHRLDRARHRSPDDQYAAFKRHDRIEELVHERGDEPLHCERRQHGAQRSLSGGFSVRQSRCLDGRLRGNVGNRQFWAVYRSRGSTIRVFRAHRSRSISRDPVQPCR